MASSPHTPIQPEGIFDGLRWGCVLRGALLDIALSIAASIPLVLWLAGPGAMSEDEATAREAMDRALASPEGLLWSAAIGLAATVIGAWYGARRAGALHVRHGGWVAVASVVIGLPLQLSSASDPAGTPPFWYEAAGLAAMIPAGMLGGFLAGRLGRSAR
jgi:hypothetical protein